MAIITIIGLGNMGYALAEGLISSTIVKKEDIKGIELSQERAEFVSKKLGIEVYNRYDILSETDFIVLAVKPQSMKELLTSVKGLIKNPIIISIAAGITVGFIKEFLGDKKIVRTMPNTAALVSKGITGVFCTDKVQREDKLFVEKILKALGEVVFVDKEEDIDKITALSGSGPAYVYYFMEAMEEAGVFVGLSRDVARKLVTATFFGSSAMVRETNKTATTLREMVTSPGGTTIAGLYCLEKGAVKGAILDAVMSAYKRSKELGGK